MNRLIFAALVFTLVAGRVRAADAPMPPVEPSIALDQLLDNMESVRKTLKTFKAAVVKVRQVQVLDETERFSGALQFKSPRLLRLDLTGAETGKETIYIVGPAYGWIYRPQEKQAERTKLSAIEDARKDANPLEYGLSQDIHALRGSYNLRLLSPEKVGEYDAIPLELAPREGPNYARGKVIFWIDRKTWLPVQVREYKSNDEIIETHTFSKIEINTSIADRTFDFEPPKGVDVIIHE